MRIVKSWWVKGLCATLAVSVLSVFLVTLIMRPTVAVAKSSRLSLNVGINPRYTGESWLSGYTYRKQITITGASVNLTNYQMPVDIFKNDDYHIFEAGWELTNGLHYGGDYAFPIKIGSTYHLYGAYLDTSWYISQVTSSTPTGSFTGNTTIKLLEKGAAGKWDADLVTSPFVIEDNGTYYMFYEGGDGTTGAVGYATSANGSTWTKQTVDAPLLDHGAAGTWDDKCAGTPSVLKDGTTWYLSYYGRQTAPAPYYIGYATATGATLATAIADGFTKYGSNPVISPSGSGWDSRWVGISATFKYGSTYIKFYEGNYQDGIPGTQIGIATSTNFSTWTKWAGNPIFRLNSYSTSAVGMPGLLIEGNDYYIYFNDDPHYYENVYHTKSSDFFNRVILNGHSQDDFDDVHFTQSGGATELDYWQESYTSGVSERVWIEFNSILASPSTATFYAYYSNAGAGSSSNGTNTFIAFDNFERGNNGDAVGGAWTVGAGSPVISTDHAYGGTRSLKVKGNDSNSNLSLNITNSDNVALRYRYWKEANTGIVAWYWQNSVHYAYWGPDVNENILANGVDTGYNCIADIWELGEANNFVWVAYTYDLYNNDLKVVNDRDFTGTGGGTNNLFVIQNQDTTTGDDLYVDDVIARNWVSLEPTWTAWGAEENVVSVSNSPSSKAFGVVAASSTYWSNGSAPSFYSATTSTNSPTASAGGWTNGANAYTDGGSYANVTSGAPSANETYQTYGYSIASDATITSVRVRLDAWDVVTAANQTKVPTGDGTMSGTYTLAQSRSPTGQGINSGVWTPSTGSNSTCIDDIDVQGTSGDADYITSPTATGGGWDGFTFTAFSVPSTAKITNVIVYERAKKTASQADSINEFIYVGAVSYNGTARAGTTTITPYSNTWTTNPATGANWTYDEVNGTDATVAHRLNQFGITSTDLSPSVITYMMMIEVNYTDANKMYAVVDETSADDTDYLKGTTDAANFHPFSFAAFTVPTGSTITNLTITYRARDGINAAIDVNNVRAMVVVNSVNYTTTDAGNDPGSVFATYSYAFTTNPNTAANWTAGDINGTSASPLQKFGISSSDGAPDFSVSMVNVVVNYTPPNDDQIRDKVSWDGGTNWSSIVTTNLTSSEVTYWDNVTAATAWTPAKLNNGSLVVYVDGYTVGDASEIRLDWIPVEVIYTRAVVADSECYFTLTNNSSVSINVTISSTNFTGGVGWGLTSGAPGADTIRETIFRSGDNSTQGTILTNSSQTFYNGLAATGTKKWELKMETGTFTDGIAKTSTITLTAVAS